MLNITSRIFRYCDLSWQALTQLKKWLQPGVDVNKLTNPLLNIAEAKNAAGHTVCYCTLEQAYMIGSLAQNPHATEIEILAAGNSIEAAVAEQAQRDGISTLLLIVPNEFPSMPGEEFVRIVRREIVAAANAYGHIDSHTLRPSYYQQ